MKALRFLFVGSPKNTAFKELEQEYLAKITHSFRASNISYVKDASQFAPDIRKQKEGALFLQNVPKNSHLIICDESGQSFSSLDFAKKLDLWFEQKDCVVFGVGGAYGFSDDVKTKASLCLRLAPWTLPHELARIVLLEQVYRAFNIQRDTPYHH